MTDDVHRLLQRADGGPGTPDHTHIRARGRRLLRTRRGAMAGAGTLLAAGLVAIVTSMPTSSPPAPVIGERSPSPSTAPQDTTDGCERPALSPTYLPWLEEGEAVPDPVHATSGSLSSPDALTVWARHPDQFDLHGPVHTDTLAIATLAEPTALDDSETDFQVLGHAAQLRWIGDPGTGGVQLRWSEHDQPCGTHALTLTISSPAEYLDAPTEGGADHPDGSTRSQLQEAIEAELLRVAQSLQPHTRSESSPNAEAASPLPPPVGASKRRSACRSRRRIIRCGPSRFTSPVWSTRQPYPWAWLE